MDILQIIQTVGFPISVALGCGWYIYKAETRAKDEAKEREEKQQELNKEMAIALTKSAEAIKDSNEVNKELSETNRMLVNEMKTELANVGNNVEKILENTRK